MSDAHCIKHEWPAGMGYRCPDCVEVEKLTSEIASLKKKLALSILSSPFVRISPEGLLSCEVCISQDAAALFRPERYVISEWEDLANRGYRIRVEETRG